MSAPAVTDRIIITGHVLGICSMQLCAVSDATDEELLAFANEHNPSGTERGWVRVVRDPENRAPVPCQSHAGRVHFLLDC